MAGRAASSADAGGLLPHHPLNPPPRRNRWSVCLSGFSCFGSQKGGKRIVPAARTPDGNILPNHGNAIPPGSNPHGNMAMNLSLLAPPSSPASFANSVLPSTVQSPNNNLALLAASPGGPSSTMYVTGPYAHDTQLVSPPVFSTYTTEPSTAPLTPPPELSHATTPSSPDVPFAKFLSSTIAIRGVEKVHDMSFVSSGFNNGGMRTYPTYPESPSSSIISPASATPRTGRTSPFPEPAEVPAQWKSSRSAQDTPYSWNRSSSVFGLQSASSHDFMLDGSFFRPAVAAQFHLDQAQQSYPSSGSLLSNSRESDNYTSSGSRYNTSCKQDVEEIEAYRASFGFSADEIIATQHYTGISEVADESFSISPFGSSKLPADNPSTEPCNEHQTTERTSQANKDETSSKMAENQIGSGHNMLHNLRILTAPRRGDQCEDTSFSGDAHPFAKVQQVVSQKNAEVKNRACKAAHSASDAEIDYRRARSLREAHGALAWRSSLP